MTVSARDKQDQKKKPLWQRIAQKVLAALLTLLLVAVFYLSVILGQPQPAEDAVTVDQSQPLLTASPALSIADENQLITLVQGFPVPVMSFLSGAGPTFVSGMSYDTAFEGGFGRIVELNYRTADGVTVKVQSIYPARAISLMGKGDYTFAATSGQTLSGLRSIRMEKADGLRFHAQSADALYVLTLPQVTDEQLAAIVKPLQLLTVKTEEGA